MSTLKSVIYSVNHSPLNERDCAIGILSLQCLITNHCVANKSSLQLSKSPCLHSNVSCISSAGVSMFRDNERRPSGRTVLASNSNRTVIIFDYQDLTGRTTLVNQVKLDVSGHFEDNSTIVSPSNTTGLDGES